MINDQAAGLGAKVVSGTPRDSLHMIDVLSARDGGQRPDIVITDSGSYSDLVFGLVPCATRTPKATTGSSPGPRPAASHK